VDPGETGTALQAGGIRGPGPPVGEGGGSWGRSVEREGRERDAAECRRRARHNIKPWLCIKWVSLCIVH
jgi:hypothetical protein